MLRRREVVLVVEEHGEVRRLVRRVLDGAGYTVLEAGGSESALRLLEAIAGPVPAKPFGRDRLLARVRQALDG